MMRAVACSLLLCAGVAAWADGSLDSHENARAAVRARDFEAAARIWRDLARAGDPEAAYRLGVSYRTGRGVPVDHEAALRLLRSAAEAGHAAAQFELAQMILNGWGTRADPEEGRAWLRRAAAAGNERARAALSEDPSAGSRSAGGDPGTALAQAVSQGDARATRQALAAGADPSARTRDGTPLLVEAVVHTRPEVARALLDGGADVDETGPDGERPLLHAIRSGDASAVSLLLDHGAAPDAPGAALPALHLAVRLAHADIVSLLIEAGADLSATDPDGRSALDLASRIGADEIERTLRRAGAPAKRPASSPRAIPASSGAAYEGWPPLSVAAQRGQLEAVRALLRAGADPDAEDPAAVRPLVRAAQGGHGDVVAQLLAAGASVEPPTGGAALRASAEVGDLAGLSALLDAGAGRGASGAPALSAAAARGDERAVDLLLAHGVPARGGDSEDPLALAAAAGHAAVVRRLVAASEGPAQRRAALCAAAAAGQADVLKALLDRGSPPTARCDGQPLLLCAAVANEAAALVLLEAGAPDVPGGSGSTALHVAASRGFGRLARALLAAGSDPERRGARGRTALMLAAQSNQQQIAELLLAGGARVGPRDDDGQTAESLASRAGHGALAERLRRASGLADWF